MATQIPKQLQPCISGTPTRALTKALRAVQQPACIDGQALLTDGTAKGPVTAHLPSLFVGATNHPPVPAASPLQCSDGATLPHDDQAFEMNTTMLSANKINAAPHSSSCGCPSCSGVRAPAANLMSVPRRANKAPKAQGRRALNVQAQAVATKPVIADPEMAEVAYLASRTATIRRHFPSALSVDDFFARVEIATSAFGFTGDNTIACSNVCRDEITITAKNKIDQIFGSSFNTNGLGGVLTCGVTGVKAGLSHSPICGSGKERYIFFSFPHISIDAAGNVGAISRPGRAGASCACGALIGSLVQIKEAGLASSCKKPGVHDYADPELSILKQRLARRMRYEGWTEQQVQEMDLVDITKVAERTISDDLEFLIKNAVDPAKADYAVITGVQIHNYGTEFDNEEPNLEFIAPTGIYAVVNGEKTYIDIESIPSLTPRQISLLASGRTEAPKRQTIVNSAGVTTARSIDAPFLYSSTQEIQQKEKRAETYAELLGAEGLSAAASNEWPTWKSRITADGPARAPGDSSVVIDELEKSTPAVEELTAQFVDKLRQVASSELLKDMNKNQ